MSGNSFGERFRITTAGESHGPANVVIIDGLPPGIPLKEEDFFEDLARRRPGQSHIVTQRNEPDHPEILSGLFEGKTTGTSLAILIRNQDQRSRDYADIEEKYRPGHADFTYDAKYGFRDYRGGGRSSARETTVRVAAGVVAKKVIQAAFNGQVLGYVTQVGSIKAEVPFPEQVTLKEVEEFADGSKNIVRCPDENAAAQMIQLIESLRSNGDSIGGIAEIVATSIPAGLGEPVFDKIKADFAKALFSLPAVLGVEYGIGFHCATLKGSENNDLFVPADSKTTSTSPKNAPSSGIQTESGICPASAISTSSNRHGGMLGGITSGQPVILRAAIKPTSSLPREQQTVTKSGKPTTIRTTGRHDPCLLPRFIPMAEAMVAIVLADHWLRWRAQQPLQEICSLDPDINESNQE